MPNIATEITERATGILYHYTSVRAALNILKSGQFELSSSVGSTAEEKYMPRGYPYFLSTTRSRVGDYHRMTGNTGVMLVLDGDYFNQQGLKVRPIDYWERSWGHPESGRSSESEDRVYSKTNSIPAKNIRQVHVLIKTQDDLRSASIRQLLITAKQLGLPAYLYKDEKDWRTQNRQRALPIKDALELLRGREPADRRTKGRNYLGHWLELVYKKSISELSDRAKYVMRNLLIYNRGHGDDDMQLAVDLSNARKPGDQNRETAIRIIELLKKFDLDTKKFVQMLYHKWHEIDSKKETKEAAQRPARTARRTYQQLSDLMAELGQVPNAELKQKFLEISRTILNLDSDDPSWALAELTRRALGLHKAHYNQTTWQWVSDLIKLKHDLNIGYQHHSDAANIEREINDFLSNQGLFRYPIEEDLRDPRDNPCWKGYHPVGTKKKNGRVVPNCVPNESIKDEHNLDESLLTEVRMSPGDLRRWAESPEADGIQSGFEAELIFRDASREDEEDYEPDYDMDERARSIDQVVEFFQGGENGISGTTARRLNTGLQEEYYEWRDEAIYDEWSNVAEEQVEDYMETNVWGDDSMRDEYREQAAEELGIETSEESADQAEAIEKLAREKFLADLEEQIENEGRYYDEARDYFRDMAADSGDYDEDAFLSARYPYMSDVGDAHGIDWPYWRGGGGNGGGRSIDDIASSLADALDGASVVGSSGYHSTTRRPGRWIVEPDGSLDPDDSDEAGLEVVSPPQPLAKTLEDLKVVLDWANEDGDAYTNSSTGLHMGISVPYKGGDVDYVKLILFLGDTYVLEQFGRLGNSYCRSALEKLRSIQQSRRSGSSSDKGPDKTAAAMDLMRKNLVELASKYVQENVGADKYTSVHIKSGYIEFRSPGNDYLSRDKKSFEVLETTMIRFARAMHIASRPDLERKEYTKKLYKLIDPQGDESLKLFLDYSTGKINQEELKKSWAQQVLSKETPSVRSLEDPKEYEVVRQDTGEVIDIIRDWTLASANEMALQKYSGKGFDFFVRVKTDAEPEKKLSRRAQVAKKIAARPTVWRVTDTNTGKTILVAADNAAYAKIEAERADDHWFQLRRHDPDSFLAEPASAAEVKQYQQQQASAQRNNIRTRPVPSSGLTGEGRYHVTWKEMRNGSVFSDSLNLAANSGDAAMASVRGALEAQGRSVIEMDVEALPSAGQRPAGEPIPGSTLDLARQRAQQSQGEFTGRWQVKDRQGNIVYTFSGVGNSQTDANRTAHTWLLAQGDRFDNRGPFDVVPEMS